MRGLLYRRAYTAAVTAALLSGCGGGVPNAATAARTALTMDTGTARNVSGEYAGTIEDNQKGTMPGSASLAQFGVSVGGPLSVGKGASALGASIAFTLSGKSLSGTLIIPGATVCAFTTSATYDAHSRRLEGSYQAIGGCSGEQGTYSFKRKCYYQRAGDALVEPQSGPKPC